MCKVFNLVNVYKDGICFNVDNDIIDEPESGHDHSKTHKDNNVHLPSYTNMLTTCENILKWKNIRRNI